MCSSRTSEAPTSVERVAGRTVGPVCGSPVMRFIVVGGPISTTIPMQFRSEQHRGSVPPVTLWPSVERRGPLPPDVEELVAGLEHAV